MTNNTLPRDPDEPQPTPEEEGRASIYPASDDEQIIPPAAESDQPVDAPVVEEETAPAEEIPAVEEEQPAVPPPAEPFRPVNRVERFLRALALAVISFALGALVVYLLLYRPAATQITTLTVQREQLDSELQLRSSQLNEVEQELSASQGETENIQSQLVVEQARSQVLRAMAHLAEARLRLVQEDSAASREALGNARAAIEEIGPLLEERSPQQASTLTALFTLADNDLGRDVSEEGNRNAAMQDMDRLQAELEMVEETMLQAEE